MYYHILLLTCPLCEHVCGCVWKMEELWDLVLWDDFQLKNMTRCIIFFINVYGCMTKHELGLMFVFQAIFDRNRKDELPGLQLEWIDGICAPLYEVILGNSCLSLQTSKALFAMPHWQKVAPLPTSEDTVLPFATVHDDTQQLKQTSYNKILSVIGCRTCTMKLTVLLCTDIQHSFLKEIPT